MRIRELEKIMIAELEKSKREEERCKQKGMDYGESYFHGKVIALANILKHLGYEWENGKLVKKSKP